jgi:hypothetical protein
MGHHKVLVMPSHLGLMHVPNDTGTGHHKVSETKLTIVLKSRLAILIE